MFCDSHWDSVGVLGQDAAGLGRPFLKRRLRSLIRHCDTKNSDLRTITIDLMTMQNETLVQ